MKIALVILHADPTRGGAERYTVDLAGALARKGLDVSLLATSFTGVPEDLKQVGFESGGLTRTARYLHALNALDRHLDQSQYDVVHAMLPVRRCNLYHPHAGLASAAVLDAPLSALLNPRRRAMAKVEQQLLYAPRPPRVLCLSEYVKRAVKHHYPLDESHLPVLFNAVDTARFTPSSRSGAHPVVALMIAQDFERKGLRQTIEALARIADPGLRLRVVGKQNPAPYQRLAARLKVRDRVDFAGPTTNPVHEYHNADFFVLPTRDDPCSLVVLESLATGLPVISTRFNGACEIMGDGVHGFVLPDPSDVSALTEAMQKLLDPNRRGTMSTACLDLRPQLSYEHHLDRLIQIYEQSTLQSAGGPRRSS